jgi:hypothetical protein
MKRFNCTSFDKRGVDGKCMEKSGKGAYVRYCDAKKEIAELKKEIDELKYDHIAEMTHLEYFNEGE